MQRLVIILFSFSISILSAQDKTNRYIEQYSQIAIEEMRRYNIPASITLAQGILESGNGESRLAVEGNNHFGIKCHANWNGETITADDDEKGECFRKYNRAADSYRDHSLFLTERGRYSLLFELKKTNYKGWAKGLKKAGYATNPKYADLLIDLIEKYDLSRFDEDDDNNKLYFANSYGAPYLIGFGMFYFTGKSVYSSEVNTSFLYSKANLGYGYEFINRFYAGINTGCIYLPTEETSLIPYISTELMYRKSMKAKKGNSLFIRMGVQVPLGERLELDNIEYKVMPYLSLNYLFD